MTTTTYDMVLNAKDMCIAHGHCTEERYERGIETAQRVYDALLSLLGERRFVDASVFVGTDDNGRSVTYIAGPSQTDYASVMLPDVRGRDCFTALAYGFAALCASRGVRCEVEIEGVV